jgi:hypothetical protein
MSRALRLWGAFMVAVIGMIVGRPTHAQWVTDNGVVVFDDGFESDTVGGKPGNPPVGSLSVTGRNAATVQVLGPASMGPGAIQGNNYFIGNRPGTNDDAYYIAQPSQPIVSGDHLVMDTWAYIAGNADFNFAMGFESPDVSTRLFAEAVSAPGAVPGTFRIQFGQGNLGSDLLDITYTPNVWQEWKLDWVVGSDQATLTVAGISQTRTVDPGDLPGDGGPEVSEFRFFSSNFPTTYYTDAEQFRAGDVNHDNIVNGLDINAAATHWLQTGVGVMGDANNDGIVNGLDINMMATSWLKTTTVGTYLTPAPGAQVPEPSTLGLVVTGLIAGSIWMRRRRAD